MADAGLPNGVIYDDYSGYETYRQYSGASAAESSLIQYFDVILGVEHYPTGEKKGDRSGSGSGSGSGSEAAGKRQHFLTEMRNYMPQSHRRFLEDVDQVSNIRACVSAHPDNRRLTEAYDSAISALREFRNKHIQLVSRYIIIKSRETTREKYALQPGRGERPKNLATAATLLSATEKAAAAGGGLDRRAEEKGQTGTGGTALMPFLKQSRDETTDMVLNRLARDLSKRDRGQPTLSAARRVSVSQAETGRVPGLSRTWTVEDMEGGLCLG